ncbi:hypothetical protein [Fluviispira multicolorata]|uniref:DUF58 domain-containing protein n=1 Tax=Fluviispira multicolorata TaxID=2654512 RepID=A0A833JFI6_9BACT|nr:hypothetical protein [Fluviispira multicolorata]KAB8033766.1 hypothetical protein GCL57_03400 [Fluviispira multicolorata]
MNFENICSVFPSEEKYWPCQHPSRALPFYIRAHLRNLFGGVFSANDLNKRNLPSRLGITIKPFEKGDPISSISKNHFIKTQNLLTRVDYGHGRQRVVVLFHCYENMLYHSEKTTINKGQLAIGITAILEEAHRSLAHSYDIFAVKEKDLFAGALLHNKSLRVADHIYIVTDLLYDSTEPFAAAENSLKLINYLHLKQCVFFITRDPLEYPIINNDSSQIEELIPWENKDISKNSHYFSGNTYQINSQNQIKYFQDKALESKSIVNVVSPHDNLSNFIQFIIKNNLRNK